MKLLFSHFSVPVLLAASTLLAGCSSDNPAGGNTAGTSAGGASSGGKGGSGGSNGGSVSGGGAGSGGAAAGGTAGSPGAAGTAGGGPAVEASFATVKNVIALNCFGGGCHSDGGNPFQMKADDTLYASLTTHTTANCGAVINKTSPADSALVKVLKGDCGTPPDKITPRMPLGTCFDGDTDPESPCIQPATIAAIQAWIAKGAPKQ